MSTNWFIGIWRLKPTLLYVLRRKVLQPNLINAVVTSWVNSTPQMHSFCYLKGKDCKANVPKYLKGQEGIASLCWEPIENLKGT
jgi:hypothetical protein